VTTTEPAPSATAALDPALRERLDAVMEAGFELFDRFDRTVRQRDFHAFVAADYPRVLEALVPLRGDGLRFLEWGSATGVITILADQLGFDACGIELDESLVEVARELAGRFGSGARFAAGSFLPTGYVWRTAGGDARMGTIGTGASGYLALGVPLDEFDVVYGYPWAGEEPMMHDLMRSYGARGARLVLAGGTEGVRVFRDGRREG
jgi:hypothetical protein